MRTLTLRQLILLLTVSTALLILANTFYTNYKTQRALLIEQTLASNYAYAAKVAGSVNSFILSAQQQLAFAAQDVLLAKNDPQQLARIVDRLKLQTNSFNSVLIVDRQGTALAITRSEQQFLGKKLHKDGAAQALKERRPLVSKPYISVTDRLVVFLTHPLFDGQGRYQGYVGGSIYLHEESILYALLGQHYHASGAYSYVVDIDGRLIYHPELERIGEVIVGNPVIEHAIKRKSGSQQLANSHGVEMLAGYAYVPSAEWGVVSQRPLAATLTSMDQQMLTVAQYSVPLFVLIMWLVWGVSRWISRPLCQLAFSAECLDRSDIHIDVSAVSACYFEAVQIKHAILRSLAGLTKKIDQLNLDSMTDPLTGLLNRRAMQVALDHWEQTQQSFSVISCDIDYFKRINDEFGHDKGDEILKLIAKHMRESSRPDDLICRVGGEEFVLLLPNTDLSVAYTAAERLRLRIGSDACPCTGILVTLSFGVASWAPGRTSIGQVMKNADRALYAAKAAGRNRVHGN